MPNSEVDAAIVDEADDESEFEFEDDDCEADDPDDNEELDDVREIS